MTDYQHQDIVEDTVKDIQEKLPYPEIHGPWKEAVLPPSLDYLSSVELGRQLGIWAGLYSTAIFEFGKAEADEFSLHSRMGRFRQIGLARAGDKEKITVVKARVEAEDEMQEMSIALEKASIRAKLLKALCDGYAKKYDAISREISRRSAEKRKWERTDHIDNYLQGEDNGKEERSWKVESSRNNG